MIKFWKNLKLPHYILCLNKIFLKKNKAPSRHIADDLPTTHSAYGHKTASENPENDDHYISEFRVTAHPNVSEK